MNNKELVIDYVVENKDYLFEKIKQYIETRDNLLKTLNFIFHEEVEKQAHDIASWVISNEISQKGIATIEESMIILSELGLKNIYPQNFK